MTPRVSITEIADPEEATSLLVASAEQRAEDVRRRAFHYFQERGQMVGNDWQDWLRAERELLWKPPAEMFENAVAIVLRVAVPGFQPRSLQVTAGPHSLLLQGCETHDHDGLDSRLLFCEFGNRLFRVFDLPKRIDPTKVSATLDKGILEIVASIARPSRTEHDEMHAASSAKRAEIRAASAGR